jgi:uncharacterized LabA/DUF88 family protein
MTPENKYLFVDGGCLESTLKRLSDKFFKGEEITWDPAKLSQNYRKTFYYDCFPQKPNRSNSQTDDGFAALLKEYEDAVSAKQTQFDSLSIENDFHINNGFLRRDRDGEKYRPHQKGVDTMIAVDMLTHSFRHNMEQATLLAGDLDFLPLLDALVREGMYTTLWYPKGATSDELIKAADSKRAFDIKDALEIATGSFLQRYGVPVYDTVSNERPAGALQKEGLDDRGQRWLEFHSDRARTFVFVSANRPDRWEHVSHRDREFLTLFINDQYGRTLNGA